MYSIEISQEKRFIGEFTRGTDLNKALDKLFKDKKIRSGNIQLSGHLSYVKLAVNTDEKLLSEHITIESNIQLLSCWGVITERDGKFDSMLYAVCAYPSETGWITTGGVISEAKILVCDFVLDVYNEVLIRKSLDQKLNIHTWSETFIAVSDEDDKEQTDNLKHIEPVDDSEISEDENEEDIEAPLELPEAGDIVVHFTFGRCEVLKINTESDIMLVKLPSGRSARLGMSVLRFVYEKTENNVKIFRAEKGIPR